ncbi:hypothetical protein RDWZM_001894, partial [Blomia tropicalis]
KNLEEEDEEGKKTFEEIHDPAINQHNPSNGITMNVRMRHFRSTLYSRGQMMESSPKKKKKKRTRDRF